MKQLFFLAFLLYFIPNFSQKIKLSIVVSNSININWKDSCFTNTSYLKIEYINNTTRRKLLGIPKTDLFNFVTFSPHGSDLEDKCVIEKTKNKIFYVTLIGQNLSLEIIDYTKKNNSELDGFDFIQGNNLQCIYKRKFLKVNKSNKINNFIFLKPHEKAVYYYDLTGFKIIGGNYTFKITSSKDLNKDKEKDSFFEKEVNSNELTVSF